MSEFWGLSDHRVTFVAMLEYGRLVQQRGTLLPGPARRPDSAQREFGFPARQHAGKGARRNKRNRGQPSGHSARGHDAGNYVTSASPPREVAIVASSSDPLGTRTVPRRKLML